MSELLPLFPLHAVLVPGAALGLRVFEPRYLDMVRDCGRSGGSFGICLILEGEEAGAPATPAAFGTEALIEDFDTGSDGLLHLRLRGARRFHALRTRVRDSGLVVADVQWHAPDPAARIQPQHALLADMLRRILEQVGADVAVSESDLGDSAWVGWRLAELLPLTLEQRQSLLQQDDPLVRLDTLLQLIA